VRQQCSFGVPFTTVSDPDLLAGGGQLARTSKPRPLFAPVMSVVVMLHGPLAKLVNLPR